MATRSKSGEHVTYSWDNRNRLVRIEFRTAIGTAVVKQVDLIHDAQDRLIQVITDSDGSTGSAPITNQKFAYDGQEIYLEFNAANQLAHRYLHGPDVDQVLLDENYLVSLADRNRWLLSDQVNSVRTIVNNAGNVMERRKYGAFGQVIEKTTTQAVDEIFGYTGRPFLDSLQLQYSRARFYDPQLGRFVSTDPTGFEGGDFNLYRYVANSPLTHTDPSGEEARNPHPPGQNRVWLNR